MHDQPHDVHTVLRRSITVLTQAGAESPALAARVLMAYALSWSTLELTQRAHDILTPEAAAQVQDMIARHAAGEPVAYITGNREFFGRDFALNRHTLIPRPETEDMLEAALALPLPEHTRFVDVGTGSGCIAVSLAATRPAWRGYMLDIQGEALRVAVHNAHTHGVLGRIQAIRGDLQHLPFMAQGFDMLISNPPYVSKAEYAGLAPGVRNYEPRAALVPDVTGLAHIQALAVAGRRVLIDGGWCLMEHGSCQGDIVRKIFTNAGGWDEICIHKDLAGLDRFCQCRAVSAHAT